MNAKTLGFAVATAVVALVGVELAARVVFSIASGESQLGYGFGSPEPEQKPGMLFPKRDDPARWHAVMRADDREKAFFQTEVGPYSRYAPGQRKRNRDEYGHISEIRINNLGFRGGDVAIDKPDGTYRVIALGASSTFGYRNRDDETWPHDLEMALEARRTARGCADVARFEVLNLGIPHLNAENLHALLLAEGLPLQPDLVAFYEGANETRLIDASLAQRAVSALGDRLLVARFVRTLLRERLASFDAAELDAQLARIAPPWLARLDAIADACAAHGVPLLVASQQAKSFAVEPERMRGVPYAREVEIVSAKLADEGRVGLKELVFLMQAALMRDLERWAAHRGAGEVIYVDGIGALDGDRDGLLSWVHLSAHANRVLAEALAEPIFERACAGASPR